MARKNLFAALNTSPGEALRRALAAQQQVNDFPDVMNFGMQDDTSAKALVSPFRSAFNAARNEFGKSAWVCVVSGKQFEEFLRIMRNNIQPASENDNTGLMMGLIEALLKAVDCLRENNMAMLSLRNQIRAMRFTATRDFDFVLAPSGSEFLSKIQHLVSGLMTFPICDNKHRRLFVKLMDPKKFSYITYLFVSITLNFF
jgi:hypothetical protein